MFDDSPIEISIDIETYSLSVPDAAVISVAAVSSVSQAMEEYFNYYEQCDLERHIDPETVAWHMREHGPQYLEMTHRTNSELESKRAADVFRSLQYYVEQHRLRYPSRDIQVWAKPPSFDFTILKHLATQVGMDLPWTRHEQFDLYTLQQIAIEFTKGQANFPPSPSNAHIALVDAEHQLSIIRQCKDILL